MAGLISSSNPALLLIDWQLAIDHFGSAKRSHPQAEARAKELLVYWRERAWPVIHIRHSSHDGDSPYHSGSPWHEFKPEVEPDVGELMLTKRENCAFIGTELEAMLRQRGIKELVFSGVLLNHSVDATIRVARALGFHNVLVEDATPAMGLRCLNGKEVSCELVHGVFVANLAGEYADIVSSRQLLSAEGAAAVVS